MVKKTRSSSSRPLRYHLRFQIVPGRRVEADARELGSFCRRHGIEEVVLFIAAEEWNNGLLSKRDEDVWFETIRKAKRVLDRAGITVSLNPWMTTLHCDRGRSFPKDRTFAPMVSPSGVVSKACASFADPRWQRYVFNLYGRFARLGFRVLWVEDDFRYHNHGPLDWGGGFEPEVLERFGKKVGRAVARPELMRAFLRPGVPHPWRRLWMETWREIQLEVARGLAQAVAKNSPVESRLGLMSSHPSSHSTEGRDWLALFEALGVEGRVTHRPHFAGYSEATGRQKTYSIMMLDLQKQFRPSNCEVAPEIENCPFTRWTKSDSLTWTEMALCQFHGSDALLLDLFPFSGNPASTEPAIGELLDRSRSGLAWIAARFPKTLNAQGVGLPWKQDAQARMRTWAGKTIWELGASPFGPGELLLPCGIPVAFTPQPVQAVFGCMAWIYDDDEAIELLSGGVMLDADSAAIFNQRGFSDLVGAHIEAMVGREDDSYSLEVVADKATGIQPGFMSNCNLLDRLARMRPMKGASEWTTIRRADRSRFGAGLVVYRNRLGGKVATFAAPNPSALPGSFQRQAMIHRLVDVLAGGRSGCATVMGSPYCLPMHFQAADRQVLVVLNGAPDAALPTVRMPGVSGKPVATILSPLSKPSAAKVAVKREKGGVVASLTTPLPYLGFLVLEW